MKWKYRLDHARVIFGLLTFALILSAQYVKYIPFLDALGFWGVLILTTSIFIGFGIFGYIYDKSLKMWQSNSKINAQRTPYTSVPDPKDELVMYGLHLYRTYVLLETNLGLKASLLVLGYWMEIVETYYGLKVDDNPEHYLKATKRCKLLGDLIKEELDKLIEENLVE